MKKAYYDKKPQTIMAVGNGSYLYHWGIEEVTIERGEEESRKEYACYEVTVWPPITANRITEVVIGAMWDKNYEQKLLNEYNAAMLGLYDETTAEQKKEAYTAFLTERAALKAQIDKDCEAWGIE